MSEENIEFVKGAYGAFARADVPAVLGAFADDIEWFEAEGMPYGGLYRGPEAVAQNVFGPITQDVDGFTLVIEELIGSGDTVVSVLRYTGTGQSDGEGARRTGSPRVGHPRRQAGALPAVHRHGQVRGGRAGGLSCTRPPSGSVPHRNHGDGRVCEARDGRPPSGGRENG
jgi:ketosteroid isomerase-like protein